MCFSIERLFPIVLAGTSRMCESINTNYLDNAYKDRQLLCIILIWCAYLYHYAHLFNICSNVYGYTNAHYCGCMLKQQSYGLWVFVGVMVSNLI
jgi:hypothetical protein